MKLYEICPKCNGDCDPETHIPIDRDEEPEFYGNCSDCTDGTLWEAQTFVIGKEYLDQDNKRHTFTGFTFSKETPIILLDFNGIEIEVPTKLEYKVSLDGEIETVKP